MSEFIRRARPTLQEFVELIRGQTGGDYRPNKAILPSALKNYCRGYPKLDIFVRIASEGVRVELIHPLLKQARFPPNHPSAVERINVLRKNIRKEQDRCRCLVVDAGIIEIWPQIFVGPFGVVDKGDGDPRLTGRVIHDLSFPEDWSVNHLTDHTDVAKPPFEHCSSIAREIIRCKHADPGAEVKVMAGDVAAAYRNACIHSEFVHVCAGHIPEDNAIVIDMSAAFGWTGSAGTYRFLGGAVAFIHGSSTDAAYPFGFYNYHWVDDHVNVAADVGSRCADIDRSLRFAMASVMGHAAANEDKFTPWSTRQKELGLIFDTVAATVAMPAAKISKAQSLVASAIRLATLTRREFRSLLGSLRHVATCVRPAKPFLQRLRDGERSLHRHTRILVSAAMRDDLLWWRHILRDPKLNGVPVDYFDALPEPDVTVVTDASDVGICAVASALRIALTYRFLPHERDLIEEFKQGKRNEFDINSREFLSCAFAVQAWRQPLQEAHPATRLIQVHFRSDNTSAVSWQWKMASRNTRAQILIRLLSSWEQSFGLRLSASHIPGSENTAADAGSRRWESDSYAQLFDNLTRGWQHEPAPSSIGDLERAWRNISESTLLPIHPTSRASEHSSSGSGGLGCEAFSGSSSSL